MTPSLFTSLSILSGYSPRFTLFNFFKYNFNIIFVHLIHCVSYNPTVHCVSYNTTFQSHNYHHILDFLYFLPELPLFSSWPAYFQPTPSLPFILYTLSIKPLSYSILPNSRTLNSSPAQQIQTSQTNSQGLLPLQTVTGKRWC